MTVLITGATGLVGARLLPRLAAAGIGCRALVRADGDLPPGVEAAKGDLFDPAALARAVEGVSAIIHLAAVFRTEDTDLIWRTNLDGTRNLLSAAKAHAPGARFVLASTGHVYDPDTPHPGREDDALAPEHAYPASKVAAEQAVRDGGLAWTVLRFPFVYGDGDGHLEMLPTYAASAEMHPAKRISTIHHRDIAAATQWALSGVLDGRIVNLADEAPTSILELARLTGGRIDGSSEPLANPWHLHLDASLARRLGFRPTVSTVYQAAREGLL